MTRSIFAERMDDVQSRLASDLKLAGFRKRGRTFNRSEEDGIVQVVNLQMWPSPIGESSALEKSMYGTFAVNLGVYISEVYAVRYPAPKDFPLDADCAIRTRLERLIDRPDFSWSLKDRFAGLLKPRSDVVAASVWDALEAKGFEFLERFSTRRKILAAWISETRWEHGASPIARVDVAIMEAVAGDRGRARDLLNQHISQVDPLQHNGRHHVDHVRELAASLGIGGLLNWPPDMPGTNRE